MYIPWMKRIVLDGIGTPKVLQVYQVSKVLHVVQPGLDFFHDQGIAAIVIVFRPGSNAQVAFLLIQPDGGSVVEANAQAQSG